MALGGGEVLELSDAVKDVPHVAVVGVVVVVGVGLGAGLSGNIAGVTVLGQHEDLVVDVLLDGGGAGGPNVVLGLGLVQSVEAAGGATGLPAEDLVVDFPVELHAEGVGVGDRHLAVGVERVVLGEVRGGGGGNSSDGSCNSERLHKILIINI